jgi:rhodanese-related sulfurtransferase
MGFKTINSATLKTWLDSGDAVLVDVREPAEYNEVNIPHSVLSPLGEISCSNIPIEDKKIVIHCLKGGRGQKACEKLLAENEALELYNLEGGITAWIEAGLPVKR